MGNGAKAAQKRERNAKDAGKGSKSQKKTNEAAKSIVCQTCRQPFFVTTREDALTEHATTKHSKTLKECFPTFGS